MNRHQAKEILVLYRPGTADAHDPAFAEALQLCERDPELKRWLDEHCALYLALRAKFKQMPVPEGLKEQILSERKVHLTPLWRRRSVVLAAVAAVAVLTGLITLWPPPREDIGFAVYRERMTGLALAGYAMDLATNDPAQIRAHLAQFGAPSDYVVPAALQKATLTGCAIERWQRTKVSMVCFRSGQPVARGQASDLWLFVIDRASVPDAPAAASPTVTPVNRATTASWSEDGKTYVLVTDRDAAFLRNFL